MKGKWFLIYSLHFVLIYFPELLAVIMTHSYQKCSRDRKVRSDCLAILSIVPVISAEEKTLMTITLKYAQALHIETKALNKNIS